MFPSGGITNKGQFKLEFFNVISPFRIKRNNEKIVCFCLFFVICFCLLFSCLFVWGFLPCFMLVFLVAVVIIVIYLIFTFVLVLFHIVFFIFYYVISKKAKTFQALFYISCEVNIPVVEYTVQKSLAPSLKEPFYINILPSGAIF